MRPKASKKQAKVVKLASCGKTGLGRPTAAGPQPAVGTRVHHSKHGEGLVVELMPDGRARVQFDKGEEHKYKPSSLHKASLLKASQLKAAPRRRAGASVGVTVGARQGSLREEDE